MSSQKNQEFSNAESSISRWLHRLVEPLVLFFILALLMLAVIWGSTYFLVNQERSAIVRQTALSVGEIADTYEARVVRALREIDTTLKLVRFTASNTDHAAVLDVLQAQNLLPPALLFTVSIVDAQGIVVESTNSLLLEQRLMAPIKTMQSDDYLVVDEISAYQDFQLTFTRPLMLSPQGVSGWVVISIDKDYFVSGYEVRSMGQKGMLALVGDNGVVRVRRIGDSTQSGEFMDIAAWETTIPDMTQTSFVTNWQDTERYTLVRQLYDFPLAIVVGLSADEQLASAQQLAQKYWQRASWASALLLIILTILARLSWHLQRARQRVMEERVLHAQRVEHLAFHDTLTELPNRAFFSHLVSQAIKLGGRQGESFALLFLDLDRFKLINDSLGHDAGDHLLKETAKRLILAVRESDVVARLGGDEFVILLRNISRRDHIEPIAKNILSSVRESFELSGHECHVSVSIGVSLFPFDGLDEQTLMKSADMAMYQAKQAGKNNVQFYTSELSAETDVRLTLESGLHRSLERQEFRLFYQSKHEAKNGSMLGMEALLRWQHPTLGLLEPKQFLSLAEENGLVIPIGKWVLETACKQSVAWQRQGFPPLTMAVNISERQFNDDSFVESLSEILATTGMEPSLLELEISESMILHNVHRTASIFSRIKKLDVKIVVDDFGTGYSSLSDLKVLPLDALKVDSSLVSDLSSNKREQSLSIAVVELGKRLSLQVFAKGVKPQDEALIIESYSDLTFNGFYSNKALLAEDVYKKREKHK